MESASENNKTANIYWQILTDEERGDIIRLVTPIRFEYNGQQCEVPAGYDSDGMSVPRFFWRSLSPKINHKTLVPSVIHDWMYEAKICTRKEADEFYYENLIRNGFGKIKSWLVYIGVRMGGGSHW